MQIGEVARKIGLSVDAIRFYEHKALLPIPPRTAGGFRQYADRDLETLGFIRSIQGLRFTLAEVRELLELRESKIMPCAPVRRRLEQKLTSVRQKLADLKRLERDLRGVLDRCHQQKRKRSTRCPLWSEIKPRKSEGAREN